MTVSALVTRNDITATASQTSFTYTFRVLEATDMDVYQNGALLASGYTVNDVGVTTGGTVTLDVGVPVGQIVSLVLAMPLDRTTNYQNSGDFLAGDVNGDFDKIYIGAIQNENEGGRSLRLQDVEPPTAGVDMTIPLKADRLGKFLAFDDVTGGPIVSSGTGADAYDSAAWSAYNFTGNGSTTAFVLGISPHSENNTQVYIDGVYQQKDGYSLSASTITFSVAPPNLSTIEVMVTSALAVGSTSSDLVSYLPAGTGAVATTVQTKLRETVSVKDFGAVGDGTTDDAAAIQLALTAGGTVYIPDGSYILGAQLVIKSNTNLILGESAIMLRAWAGTTGQRPNNATIKNENAPLAAAINVDPGPLVPSVWDTNIHISGGQWGHKDDDPVTYRGTHVALVALRYGSFKSSQFNTQRAEWCTFFWVENFSVDDLQFNVAEGNVDVSNDALHIVGGKNITISNIRGGCDDDLIAIGYSYNLPIDGVVVNNIACQTNSNAVKVYQIRSGITSGYAAPTEEVKNITVTNVAGSVAATKTGVLDVLIEGHTQYNLVKNISFSDVNVTYAGTHDDANTIVIDVSGGNNIYFNNISMLGSPVRSTFTGANCTNLRIHNFNNAQPSKASA